MSYARFTNDSDVYVYADRDGFMCWVAGAGDAFDDRHFGEDELPELIKYLEDMKAAGYAVPDYCLESLREELPK